jgi:hypothetical protein
LGEVAKFDETMKMVLGREGVNSVVVERDALQGKVEKVEAQLFVVEIEVAKLEVTHKQHLATHTKSFQKLKTTKLLMFAKDKVKLALDIRI